MDINTLGTLTNIVKAQELIAKYLDEGDASCDLLGDASLILDDVATDVLATADLTKPEANTNDEN